MVINLNYLIAKLREPNDDLDRPYQSYFFDPRYGHHFPYFTQYTIEAMLLDSRVRYGLKLLKGPVFTYTKFFNSEEAKSPYIHDAIVELNYHFPYAVECESPEVEEFIIDQLNRFWERGVHKALTALDWGFSASEVIYKKQEDRIVFDNLVLYPHQITRCVTRNKAILGFTHGNDESKFVPIGKGFWHVHQRERHRYYGESVLKGAHVPWHEQWTLGGARDIRRTWFFKNAYDGGTLYFPPGSSTDRDGNVIWNEEFALQMMESKRTGSGMILPSTKSGFDNKRDWEYDPPKANVTPQGMDIYLDNLRDEILEGMGIPPEVVQSGGGDGLGSATGRMVPLMAFIASLSPICSDLIYDFCAQVLSVLLIANKMETQYRIRKIVPKSGEGKEEPTPVQQKTIEDTGLTP